MRSIARAFSSVFSDDEWFNKVLVGGLYLLLIPFGIGLVMVNGYFAMFAAGRAAGERSMPLWRNFSSLFRAGLPSGFISLIVSYASVISAVILIPSFSLFHVIGLMTLLLSINSVFVVRRIRWSGLLMSTVMLLLAVSFGWMWIVVGWPLLIFLATLVQISLLTER